MMQNFLLQVLRLRLMVCGIYIIIMEDYILREIDKIGKLIEALFAEGGHPAEKRGGRGRLRNRLDGVGGGARSGYRHSAGPGGLYRRADPRVWLQRREPGKIRRAAVRFRGRFARSDATVRLACGITAIYRYLDEKKALVSLNRYYILKELENMTAR